ncbi:tetraacyldisaccharide 4'-kinase [Cellvibrio zantedeschiae]|uniref:Tetraacyldisaccharide 4'-kinase n=1 Tax=Cellvibrio zantedeschiae TaxID=1237077 RepID=A0ABQ3AZC4_9GAMM|nr:tetraacyldisaccharide 4'-kinase [Cellvibrio zantedeschiae]GGY71422.1 tetraacyldisaccharide 4'-kinase [Cellvibrio zantedeschiae]
MKKSHNFWLKAWYGNSAWIYLLLPLSWLFALISALRKFILVHFLQKKISIPVIIVGNISVGGTGKTPLIIELVKYLQNHGHKPGVVSRGYGGTAPNYPYLLNEKSLASEAGDEPLLIQRTTQCFVCVAPDRVAAAKKLEEQGCTIILSDDGMQHYALGRALEVAVVDGQRLFGNQQLLPVGPLREPVSRLKSVDFIVINNPVSKEFLSGYHHLHCMKVQPLAWRKVASWQECSLTEIDFKSPIHAVAGIGNPERFFKTLDGLSLNYYAHCFPDHHKFSADDFADYRADTIVMTEKDAVKCQAFAKSEWYSLVVGAQLNEYFWQAFQHKLDSL